MRTKLFFSTWIETRNPTYAVGLLPSSHKIGDLAGILVPSYRYALERQMFHAAKKLRKCHAYVLVQNTCKRRSSPAEALLEGAFGPGSALGVVSVPGRVVIIGDHIDYHNLPVLAMAIQRKISIAFRARGDRLVRAISAGEYGCRQFLLEPELDSGPAGDWANYLKAAANATQKRWKVTRGVDAAVTSDLPPAAGLSSSSALVAGSMIALLRANEIYPTVDELMEILPEAEQFVGTRGGGMDHAVVLASRPRLCAFGRVFAAGTLPDPDSSGLVICSCAQPDESGKVGSGAIGIQRPPRGR